MLFFIGWHLLQEQNRGICRICFPLEDIWFFGYSYNKCTMKFYTIKSRFLSIFYWILGPRLVKLAISRRAIDSRSDTNKFVNQDEPRDEPIFLVVDSLSGSSFTVMSTFSLVIFVVSFSFSVYVGRVECPSTMYSYYVHRIIRNSIHNNQNRLN